MISVATLSTRRCGSSGRRRVYANLDWIDEDALRTDAAFMIAITHQSGVRSCLSSALSGLVSRELRLLSPRGNYVSDQTDVQAQAVFWPAR